MSTYDENLSSEHLHVALRAAKIAAEISRKYYASNLRVEIKEDLTLEENKARPRREIR